MNSSLIIVLFASALLTVIGCTKNSAQQTGKAREDAEAKTRAEAARKEMQTLPKVFSTPDYFKKNEPAKTDTTTASKTPPVTK